MQRNAKLVLESTSIVISKPCLGYISFLCSPIKEFIISYGKDLCACLHFSKLREWILVFLSPMCLVNKRKSKLSPYSCQFILWKIFSFPDIYFLSGYSFWQLLIKILASLKDLVLLIITPHQCCCLLDIGWKLPPDLGAPSFYLLGLGWAKSEKKWKVDRKHK